jgi:DNA-binding NarL/FixJ family response regulator
MSAGERIRVCLIDDHLIVRSGLRLLLDSQPDIEVVGEASGRQEAMRIASALRPNVFVVDLHLHDGELAVDFIGELLMTAWGSRAIVLTGIADQDEIQRGIMAGATGLVYKDEATDVLVHAIRKVHAGEAWLGRTLTAAVLARLSRLPEMRKTPQDAESDKISMLTRREREIIALVASGYNRKATAEKLFISEATVRNHLTSILGKLSLHSKFDLVFYAQRHGLADASNSGPNAS